MMNKSKITRFLSLSFAAAALVLISGSFVSSYGQNGRDPFMKNPVLKPKNATPTSTSTKPTKPVAPAIVVVSAPSIEQRIAYYKFQRERAAMNGQEIPKVTSVLTLDEMSVIGIFRTPRGFAAMVEAKPIKLSYTIYPGERFFDGQLVAIEENKLIFRKVTKMSNNKLISSVENKTLREYTMQEEVQGTAPIQQSGNTEVANQQPTTTPVTTDKPVVTTPSTMVSPLDEMNKQQTETKDSANEKPDKKAKKPIAKKQK